MAGVLLLPLASSAQQAPQVSSPDTESTQDGVATVSVTAARSSNRLDRQVFDVKTDTAASNDTVADILNKVPAVAVDSDGKVTLRGKSDVQILVDGKPTAIMQGENRAAAIQALPAADLESVEVINNPGAQFGNEGGGGPIINLVMRRERRPGGFAAINANVGTAGRFNTSGFGSYTAGLVSVQGSVFGRRDRHVSVGQSERERIDPASGAAARSAQHSRSDRESDAAGFNGALSYNIGTHDVLSGNVGFFTTSSDAISEERYRGTTAAGVVDSEYLRATSRGARNRNYSLGSRLDHKGSLLGETLTLDLRMTGSEVNSDSRHANEYSVRPVTAAVGDSRLDNLTKNGVVDFTGDYERPVDNGVLRLGYKVARNSNVFDSAFLDVESGTLAERTNPSRTNRFELDETTLALYGSYQWRINSDWGVLGGLRAEYTDVDMYQVTAGILASNDYLDAIPSAFVTYGWSDDTTLRLSYAHRIRRPGAGELNPFVVYQDELNVSSGNPKLRPSDSDSLELGVENTLGKVNTSVRLYVRRDTDLISERRYFINDDVLLTTRENAGSSRSEGVEFSFSGKPTPKLTIHASGNLGRGQHTVVGSEHGHKRTTTSLNGRARLSYQLDRDNQFQLTVDALGKMLFGDGYRQPVRTADFSYRHNISQELSLVVNVNDLFDSRKMESVTETDLLRESSTQRPGGRVAYVGLSYRFGTRPNSARGQAEAGGGAARR